MFNLLLIIVCCHHQLFFSSVDTSSILFTINDLRYSLSDRIVTVPNVGSVRGILIDYQTNYEERYGLTNVEAFLGLQYGSFHKRFEPSKERFEHRSMVDVRKLIQFGPACPQLFSNIENSSTHRRSPSWTADYHEKLLKFVEYQSEDDCLTMNIYQPYGKNLQKMLPVLLFVHGDGFDMGTGAAFDGSVVASYTKSLVVTINYRLGPFGFLYISQENPGNYALQDIYTGLHWLKNNVAYFNGDPDRITVYGTGTGGVLASLVAMMETVNGGTKRRRKSLLHRLILADQTFLTPSMTTISQETLADRSMILSHFSCSSSTCLQNRTVVSTEDLLQSAKQFDLRPLEEPFPFDQSTPTRLRTKFLRETHRILSENLSILLIASPSNIETRQTQRNALIDFAYTRWNFSTNQFEFDPSMVHYHQHTIGPLLEYGKIVSTSRQVHIVERISRKFPSELPLTMGYVLAPSMSVFNQTFYEANDSDREESLKFLDLMANLIHQGNVNHKSPYCRQIEYNRTEEWVPLFPQLNFLILKGTFIDGDIQQERGHHAQVHYLFNYLDLSDSNKLPVIHRISSREQIIQSRDFLVTGAMVLLVFVLNGVICCCCWMIRRGRGCRKREYNCLTAHPLSLTNSSPSSTNSQSTMNQKLVINTDCVKQEHRTPILCPSSVV